MLLRESFLLQKRLSQKHIKLTLDKTVKKYLAQKGFEPSFGARPLKRVIQNEILDELALLIIEGKLKEGAKIKVSIKNGKIVFISKA